jgi:NADH-quinone oxidoreductase subunit M
MLTVSGILPTLVGVPFLGALILALGSWSRDLVRWFTLLVKALVFYVSLVLCGLFDNTLTANWFQCLIEFRLWENWPVHLGVDGISLALIMLTTLIMPISLLVAWNSITLKWRAFGINMLVLEGFLLLSFTSLDLFVFYLAFESVLIPMFLIIGIWGARLERVKAAWYFFFFTLVGSIFLLIAIIVIYMETGSTNFFYMNVPTSLQSLVWFSFFVAFAVKIPTWPFHLWLPEAHVEAPTPASIILASLLLKLGGYGYLRFLLPIYGDVTSNWWWPVIAVFSVGSIIFASINALRQLDIKRVIAYSSIAHMNLAVLGMFSFTYIGIHGSVVLMLAHGFVSGALFLLIGVLYDRYHTRIINQYGGLTQIMPLFAVFFLFFTFANMGIPLSYNFVGELLSMLGIGVQSWDLAVLAGLGLFASALYSIWLANRILYGNVKITYLRVFADVTLREFALLFMLVVVTLYFGILPHYVDSLLETSIWWLVNN